LADGIAQRQWTMFALFCFVLSVSASPFKSKIRLVVENAALRHQLIALRSKFMVGFG
jgi:hypothetical protein